MTIPLVGRFTPVMKQLSVVIRSPRMKRPGHLTIMIAMLVMHSLYAPKRPETLIANDTLGCHYRHMRVRGSIPSDTCGYVSGTLSKLLKLLKLLIRVVFDSYPNRRIAASMHSVILYISLPWPAMRSVSERVQFFSGTYMFNHPNALLAAVVPIMLPRFVLILPHERYCKTISRIHTQRSQHRL